MCLALPPVRAAAKGAKRTEGKRRQEKAKNDEMIRMLKKELVQVKNGVPQIVEDTLKRLGVTLPESSSVSVCYYF
ncbi:unnamed protein product [Linum trigynum]|uniref:Uncharacterized protein n=1 Tax=Linum trigynum TaxID=586398 RepID=A0AAV2E1V4_9ROSI